MKRILLFVLMLAVLSCSKSDPNYIEPTESITPDKYELEVDKDGISKNDPSYTFEVIRYITRLDTTIIEPNAGVAWITYISEGDSISASWTVPSNFIHVKKFTKTWDAAKQQWRVHHSILIDKNTKPTTGDISVSLKKLSTGQVFNRSKNITIKQISKSFDLFRVNFGMVKTEVKENESLRLGVSDTDLYTWRETSPNFSIIPRTSDDRYTSATVYEFDSGKLKYVHIAEENSLRNDGYIDNLGRYKMISLAEKHGTKIPVFEAKKGSNSLYRTEDKVSWLQNGIRITFGLRNVHIDKEPKNFFIYTYEKAF